MLFQLTHTKKTPLLVYGKILQTDLTIINIIIPPKVAPAEPLGLDTRAHYKIFLFCDFMDETQI